MFTKAEQVTGTVEIWAVPRQPWESKDKPLFTYQIGRSYRTGEVRVSAHEVTLQVPAGVNLLLAALETLEASKVEAFEEYQRKAAKVDKQIAELRLLAAPAHEEDPAYNYWNGQVVEDTCKHGQGLGDCPICDDFLPF